MKVSLLAAIALLAIPLFGSPGFCAGPVISLGPFQFDGAKFGDTLLESDGGDWTTRNWLNVVDVNPGNPAYLTGPNFDTGIINIGSSPGRTYTVGYNTPIVNGIGNDLGVVVARFSTDDFRLAVSMDGVNFTSEVLFLASSAVSTGVSKSYFNHGSGPYLTTLYVHPINLTSFGIPFASSIQAARIRRGITDEVDVIRIAGFAGVNVPEPSVGALLSAVAIVVAARRNQRGGKSGKTSSRKTPNWRPR